MQTTSLEAYESVTPKLNSIQKEVLALFKEVGEDGLTDEELSNLMGSNASTYRTRRSELVQKGVLVDSGLRRKLLSGRNAIVWKLT